MENQRFLVPLPDGLSIEAVYYGSGTLCLSSQAGCALRCPFCASGHLGLRRNLTVDELWQQVEMAQKMGLDLKRLTLSGIGEPLHNAETVMTFLKECRNKALPLSLTTTGYDLSRLEEFLTLPHNGLMLSLHAGTTMAHRRLIPHGPDFNQLWNLLEQNLPRLSRRQRRKIGVNYLLLKGRNDSLTEVDALITRLRPFPDLTLHLLRHNPVPESAYASSDETVLQRLYDHLCQAGVQVRRPNRWRNQSDGGCGTLVLHQDAKRLFGG
ncbi:MAG: hypothetical protein C0621_07410 [Desulfuromonas sp.]|nr:MAG: hypothetical protein C0621_07410 [Desulfuromonas sp.]